MKEIRRIQIRNRDTGDISSLIEVALAAGGYPEELKIRYSFIFEEVLLKWKEELDADQVVDFVRYESGSDFRYEISTCGEKKNPFQENTSADMADSFISIMRSGLGQELKYRYRDGKNIIFVTLPKKDPDRTLFERNMVTLSIPVILQMLILNLSSVLDSVMLSFYDQTALSAASLIAQYTSLFNAFVLSVGTGMTVILSRYWTKRDFETSNRVVAMVMIIQGIGGLIFFALAEFLPEAVMHIYTSIPDVYAEGVRYLRVIAPYYLLLSFGDVYVSFMRNVKDVFKGSLFVIISQLTNCILNGFLIFGLCGLPRLGIVGAGLSTSISGLVLVVLTAVEYGRSDLLRLKLRDFTTIPRGLWKEFSAFTFPLTVKHFTYFAATNAVSAIIGHTSSDAVAAVAVRNTVYNFVRSIDNGTASIASLVMAPVMTLKKKEKALENSRKMTFFLLKLASCEAALFGLVRFAVPYLFGSMSTDALLYLNIMWILSVPDIFLACMNNGINSSVLLPSGDTVTVFLIDTAVMWGCIVLGMFVGTSVFHLSVSIVVAIICLDEIISFPMKFGRYKSLKWCRKLK